MLGTLHAPYVGQIVRLLAQPELEVEEEVAEYLGEGVFEVYGGDGDGLVEVDLSGDGVWLPANTGATTAEQYWDILTGPTGQAVALEQRVLLREAYRTGVAIGLVGEYAYSYAVRVWQAVYENQGTAVEASQVLPENTPVVAGRKLRMPRVTSREKPAGATAVHVRDGANPEATVDVRSLLMLP